MPFWKKTGRNNSEVKEEKPEGFYIQCPFCGQRFLPSEVKFRFEVGEDREIRYFCTDTEKTCGKLLKEYCQEHGYKCKLKMKNGIPMEMVLEGKTEVLRSPFRVCANDNCNQGLSNHAGFYPPGNGIFFLGERSSGKTVMLTTLVKVLQERAVSFLAELVPYNERVKEEYRKNYYDVLYRERMMPKATVAFHSMAFEWIKYGAGENRMTELNFSDIRGEDADNAMRIFNGMSGKNIQNSPGFILTVDLKAAVESQENREKTMQILQNVLEKAVLSDGHKKLLAVVITKSDLLMNCYNSPVLVRTKESVSTAYRQLDYQKKPFSISGREEIQQGVRELLTEKFPQLVLKAESVFQSSNVGYFLVSALGSAPRKEHLETEEPMPIRVEEPVLWMLDRMGML